MYLEVYLQFTVHVENSNRFHHLVRFFWDRKDALSRNIVNNADTLTEDIATDSVVLLRYEFLLTDTINLFWIIIKTLI